MARLGEGIGLTVIAFNRSAIKDAPVPCGQSTICLPV
jgi:hypothetical protein